MATEDDADLQFQSALENPALAAAALAMAQEEEAPALPNPLDGPLSLPGGFRRLKPGSGDFEVVTDAWVRELNGEDEERIARAQMRNGQSAFVESVLEAGVEKLGGTKPTSDDFEGLFMGDRDFLLMEIARVTYGDSIDFNQVECPRCGQQSDISLSLSEDVPLKRLKDFSDSRFDVRLRNNVVANCTLITSATAEKIADLETTAEINTIIVANAVLELRKEGGETTHIAGDVAAAKKLGIVDRQTIVNAVSERMPGPQYNGVRIKHEPGCGEEILLAITLQDLFRGM